MPKKTLDADVGELAQSLGLLVRRLRALGGPGGFSLTEAALLRRLAQEGPATAADLAREAGIKPQSMGACIAGLEKSGLVERQPHLTDGRQMTVSLSAKGSAQRRSERDRRRSWLAAAVAQLDPREQKTLFAAGEIMKRLARA